jgi:hypothetical protein
LVDNRFDESKKVEKKISEKMMDELVQTEENNKTRETVEQL